MRKVIEKMQITFFLSLITWANRFCETMLENTTCSMNRGSSKCIKIGFIISNSCSQSWSFKCSQWLLIRRRLGPFLCTCYTMPYTVNSFHGRAVQMRLINRRQEDIPHTTQSIYFYLCYKNPCKININS